MYNPPPRFYETLQVLMMYMYIKKSVGNMKRAGG